MKVHTKAEYLIMRRVWWITTLASIGGVLGGAWAMYQWAMP